MCERIMRWVSYTYVTTEQTPVQLSEQVSGKTEQNSTGKFAMQSPRINSFMQLLEANRCLAS